MTLFNLNIKVVTKRKWSTIRKEAWLINIPNFVKNMHVDISRVVARCIFSWLFPYFSPKFWSLIPDSTKLCWSRFHGFWSQIPELWSLISQLKKPLIPDIRVTRVPCVPTELESGVAYSFEYWLMQELAGSSLLVIASVTGLKLYSIIITVSHLASSVSTFPLLPVNFIIILLCKILKMKRLVLSSKNKVMP